MLRGSVILALFLVSAVVIEAAFREEVIDAVNRSGKKWTASRNKFSTWSNADISKLMGTALVLKAAVARGNSLSGEGPSNAPDSFDARKQWPSCIHPIRNQLHCGSCWAFSASEVLSDRFCIDSKGTVNVVLSPQDEVSCDTGNMGCEGGQLAAAWKYLVKTGIVTEKCFPYSSGQGVVESCPSTCKDGTPMKKVSLSDCIMECAVPIAC